MKTYRPYAPDQSYLLPPSPGEWLPKDHLAYFILDLVAELDLGEIERRLQAKDRCEWLLVCATHNLLKLWRAVSRPGTASTEAAVA